MKLVNYNRGYSEKFECSIHGTIYMNRDEYDRLVGFVYRGVKNDSFEMGVLYKRFANRLSIKGGFLLNLGVSYTQAIAKRFGLRGYQARNYQLCVVDRG